MHTYHKCKTKTKLAHIHIFIPTHHINLVSSLRLIPIERVTHYLILGRLRSWGTVTRPGGMQVVGEALCKQFWIFTEVTWRTQKQKKKKTPHRVPKVVSMASCSPCRACDTHLGWQGRGREQCLSVSVYGVHFQGHEKPRPKEVHLHSLERKWRWYTLEANLRGCLRAGQGLMGHGFKLHN